MKNNAMSQSRWLLSPLAITVALLAAAPAHATLVYSIQSVFEGSPSTGDALEVELTNTVGSSAVTIGGFAFGLNAPNGNFTFTDATDATTDTYIFAGDSLFGPEIADTFTAPLPGTVLDAEDAWDVPLGGFILNPGVTIALGEVFFNVASGVSDGPYTVTFNTTYDSLSDDGGNTLTFDDTGTGTITIGAVSTPEPSTLALLALALISLFCARKRLRA